METNGFLSIKNRDKCLSQLVALNLYTCVTVIINTLSKEGPRAERVKAPNMFNRS